VIRERIFRSVLLPAPFSPMMPTFSPRATVKDTPRSAQNVVACRLSVMPDFSCIW
jgi:hypothetical protein